MSSICVVGADATMVADALHQVVSSALGDLDPAIALQDFTVKDVTTSSEPVIGAVMDALSTPPFLVAKRVVVVRDAQGLAAADVEALIAWMGAPTPDVELVVGVVGTKANKLAKSAGTLREVNVGSRAADRVQYVKDKMAEYHVNVDANAAQKIAERFGEDVARVDPLARTLHSIFGTAPLNFDHVDPYLGEAGDVPSWDLTDAIEAGDAEKAITVARRMLDSRSRSALQLIATLQRYFLNLMRLSGAEVAGRDEAAQLLSMNPFPAGKALAASDRLGPERVATAVRWVMESDLALKGGVTYGSRDLDNDRDPTEVTVIEVLVARLARLFRGARRR